MKCYSDLPNLVTYFQIRPKWDMIERVCEPEIRKAWSPGGGGDQGKISDLRGLHPTHRPSPCLLFSNNTWPFASAHVDTYQTKEIKFKNLSLIYNFHKSLEYSELTLLKLYSILFVNKWIYILFEVIYNIP